MKNNKNVKHTKILHDPIINEKEVDLISINDNTSNISLKKEMKIQRKVLCTRQQFTNSQDSSNSQDTSCIIKNKKEIPPNPPCENASNHSPTISPIRKVRSSRRNYKFQEEKVQQNSSTNTMSKLKDDSSFNNGLS